MAHKIPSESLTPGTTVVVEGTLVFSRLVTPFAGEELARRVEQDRQRGRLYPTTTPYYALSLVDPKIIQLGSTPTVEEERVGQDFFTHKTGKYAGRTGYNFESVSKFPPERFQFLGHSQITPIEDDRELASDQPTQPGLRVRLLLKIFRSENFNRNGIGLDAILVMDQARFFEPQGGAAAASLRALGLTIVEPPAETQAPVAAPAATPAPVPTPAPVAPAPVAVSDDPWGDGGSTAPAATATPAFVGSSGWD